MNPNLLALLPELILTVAGVLVMLAEPLLPTGRSRRPLGYLAILAAIAAGAASWFQLHTVAQNHGISILAFSNTLQVDAYSVFFHLLIAATVAVALLASLDFFDTQTGHAGEYFALVLFAATGMMLMTSATELLVVFIGLEISSISTYIMAGFRKGNAPGAESSLKYFLLGSFATAFFLYGIALAFGATASTSIPIIAARIAVTDTPALAFLALGMILIGLGFKVSAAPFHVWTPDVYQGAPAPIVGLMSTAPKAAAFAVLLRICFVGFGPQQHRWAALLWIMAALSMTIGNLGALKQLSVKRMLAYSSIAHAGYLLAAFTAFPADGISAAAFYTAAYTAMTLGAFVVVTHLAGPSEHTRTLEDFTGAALRRPWLGALMAFFLLSMIGIPFTGGFFAKFYVFSAAFAGGHWLLVVVGLLNSGLACFYYLRLLVAMYARHPHERGNERATFTRLTPPAALALAATALATLYLGILPGHILTLSHRGAMAILTVPRSGACDNPDLPCTFTARPAGSTCGQPGVNCRYELKAYPVPATAIPAQ